MNLYFISATNCDGISLDQLVTAEHDAAAVDIWAAALDLKPGEDFTYQPEEMDVEPGYGQVFCVDVSGERGIIGFHVEQDGGSAIQVGVISL